MSPDRTGRAGDNDVAVLPGRVREPLGELVGAAREGLLSRPVQVGLGVLRELLEEEVEEIVGPKSKWNADRTAVRHGHENVEVTLGGRHVQLKRSRVRSCSAWLRQSRQSAASRSKRHPDGPFGGYCGSANGGAVFELSAHCELKAPRFGCGMQTLGTSSWDPLRLPPGTELGPVPT